MPTKKRPEITAAVKHAVRQRCGFGCVMCGLPIYHYDHVQDYAAVREHEENNLVLLCPNHHDDKTRHRLNMDALLEAKANPHNLKTGFTTPHAFYFGGTSPTVQLGPVTFTMERDDFAPFVVDGLPLIGFRFEDGHPLLQLYVFDENNKLVLKIVDSELVHSVALWDFEFVGATLTLRPQKGEIMLAVRLAPNENLVEVSRGTLRYNKVEIEIWPEGVVVLNGPYGFGGGLNIHGRTWMTLGRHAARYPALFVQPVVRREFNRAEARQWVQKFRSEVNALPQQDDPQ
jgi:HNH endonuclease